MGQWMNMIDVANTRTTFVRHDNVTSKYWGMEELPLTYGQELSGQGTLNLPDFIVAVQRFVPGKRSFHGEDLGHSGKP